MLKGAVVGFGRMGLTHFSILNSHPDVEFAAVCDSSSFMLKNIEKYTELKTFTSSVEMYEKVQPDFVIIATPTSFHYGDVKEAVKRGIHTFVEKPFVLNVTEGEEITGMLNGNRLINQVGYVIRFNEIFVKIKQLINDGFIGKPLTYKMEMNGPTVSKPVKSGWRSKKSNGGGCLYDFASHSIDLINYLVGKPKKITGTILKSIYSVNVEDQITSTFIHDGNLSGTLMVNWSDTSYRKPAYKFELMGDRGKVIADMHAFKLFLNYEPSDGKYMKGWNNRYITDFSRPVRFYLRGNEFTRQLDYFIDSIMGRTDGGMCTFNDGLNANRVIEEIMEDNSYRNN
ncbi:MAG: Gfo/Idh/MocA family oxidoreductase [Phycisphaerae bacterium]|jgi:predicted dehydrogenase